MSISQRDHAIVIGGGIAGLLTARVVSEHFTWVSILDRDHFPEQPGPRPCIPQGRHLHLLMARGLRIFERFLPGFSEELASAGGALLDFADDAALYFPGGWMPRFPSGVECHACTRDLLEWTLRRQVLANDRIQVLEGRRVSGLLATPTGGADRRVLGVRLADGEDLVADLVFETGGRASRAPDWLQDLSYPKVAETVIEAPLDYASRWYEKPKVLPESDRKRWKLLAVSPQQPKIPAGGTICQVEGDRWNVLLLGLGVEVPADEVGFLEFARNLATPDIYEAIRDARPISQIHRYRNNRNRIRHFERLADWPEGFLVLGDAACALNPYAGLGMTSSALAVEALDEQLRELGQRNWAHRVQAGLAEVHQEAWRIATNQHLLYWPDDVDASIRQSVAVGDYLARLLKALTHDQMLSKTMLEVMHMLKPPEALFSLECLRRVLPSSSHPFVSGRRTEKQLAKSAD